MGTPSPLAVHILQHGDFEPGMTIMMVAAIEGCRTPRSTTMTASASFQPLRRHSWSDTSSSKMVILEIIAALTFMFCDHIFLII